MSSYRFILQGTWLLFSLTALAAPEGAGASSTASSEISPALFQALEKSGGQLTPPVRAAYLDWAEQSVLDQLAAANVTVSAPCLAEVNADATLRDAMFAAVYPPDPSILQNYAYLRDALGAAYMSKYRSLVVGIAVARRTHHVAGTRPAPANDSASLDDADDSAVTPEDQVSDETAAAESPPPQNNPVVTAFVNYMKQHNLSALQLYQDPAQQPLLFANLQTQGFPPRVLAQDERPGRYVALLKAAMVQLGQRPARREAQPDQVAWLRYLASIYEAKPSSVPKGKAWPLFPIATAPWPLLMPFTHTVPLGEARYIWEKFQGEHGPDRFHSYGPYRGPAGVIPHELQPSAWSWGAWPSRIDAGGECIVMSGITTDLYSALGKPSVRAAQPHHSNLISFNINHGQWFAVIEQAFAGGPPVTHARWLFHDSVPAPRLMIGQDSADSEYHLGLAQAMNAGLRSYIDTRIAVNLYDALPAPSRKTLGANLLTQAIATNPYNPEPWYLLAQQSPDAIRGLALAQAARKQDPAAMSSDSTRAPIATLENWAEPSDGRPIETAIHNYWRTLNQFVARLAILPHPVPENESDARAVYDFLKTVPGITSNNYTAYSEHFGDTPNSSTPVPQTGPGNGG